MVKKRPDYRSPAILWFLKKSGKVDPEGAVKAEANKLLLSAGLTDPPFEPSRVAPLRKVTSMRRANIPVVSQLMPVEGGFIIATKRASPQGVSSRWRDKFSIAHEIGHTLFYDVGSPIPIRPHGDPGSEAEERLCDIFAAELLMPQERFKSDACAMFDRVKSWCETLFQLRSLYGVSMRAVAERVVELKLIDGAAVIRWRWKPKAKRESDIKLRVDWSVPLRDGRYYVIWPDKSAPSDSVFVRASLGRSLLREEVKLHLGTLKGDFIVETKSYHSEEMNLADASGDSPRPVLSVVWPKATAFP